MYEYMSSTFLHQEGVYIYIYIYIQRITMCPHNKKHENVMNNEYLCKLGEFFTIYDILT